MRDEREREKLMGAMRALCDLSASREQALAVASWVSERPGREELPWALDESEEGARPWAAAVALRCALADARRLGSLWVEWGPELAAGEPKPRGAFGNPFRLTRLPDGREAFRSDPHGKTIRWRSEALPGRQSELDTLILDLSHLLATRAIPELPKPRQRIQETLADFIDRFDAALPERPGPGAQRMLRGAFLLWMERVLLADAAAPAQPSPRARL